ncbi:MAG: outer membrane protein assembly factor BamB family protein [Bacteroidales bacterium]
MPGIIIVVLQWLIRFILPVIVPDLMAAGMLAGVAGGLALMIWWVFFSRATRIERWGALILILATLIITSFLIDESIATANMGMMFIMYSIPVMSLLFIIWVILSRKLSPVSRRITMVVTICIASGMWIFLRTDGMTGDGRHDLNWRWAPTHEERMLAQQKETVNFVPAEMTGSESEWPGFRGVNRDGIVRGINIQTDWSSTPPAELWRRPVGPGCSSFAVKGHLLFTQEQLGEYELVTCYHLLSGDPVWIHRDSARFYDSHAGPGPRSTPTIAGNTVFTLGATGILNALNLLDGSVIWSRDALEDTGAQLQAWACAGSPLVMGNLVIVSVSGSLAGYDVLNGNLEWLGPAGATGYSSPHPVTISGVTQVILMSNLGAISVDPSSGTTLWEYDWPVDERILQPAVLENGDLLFTRELKGLRRITVTKQSNDWKITEHWTSSEMSLNFNDVVIHRNHVYGFDGPSLACMNLDDGMLSWKGNRYRGWLLLIPDQDLLLVLTEKGELALVEANPDQFKEISRIPAIHGKTWNHPALAGDILLVRNANEMAAFRLPLKTTSP